MSKNLIGESVRRSKEMLLVKCHFANDMSIHRQGQGVSQLTASARRYEMTGEYCVRFIFYLFPGAYLYSQHQNSALLSCPTRIDFDHADIIGNSRLFNTDQWAETGKRFVHTNRLAGLEPRNGNRVTLIQFIRQRNDLDNITGKISYQAFDLKQDFESCEQRFKIRLD